MTGGDRVWRAACSGVKLCLTQLYTWFAWFVTSSNADKAALNKLRAGHETGSCRCSQRPSPSVRPDALPARAMPCLSPVCQRSPPAWTGDNPPNWWRNGEGGNAGSPREEEREHCMPSPSDYFIGFNIGHKATWRGLQWFFSMVLTRLQAYKVHGAEIITLSQHRSHSHFLIILRLK